MCLTDLSLEDLRVLRMVRRELSGVPASFHGVSDDMLRTIGAPLDARLEKACAFRMTRAQTYDVRRFFKESPELREHIGAKCDDLLCRGRAIDVVSLFIEGPRDKRRARERLAALLRYRGLPLVPAPRASR
jgi:hypothetical protein